VASRKTSYTLNPGDVRMRGGQIEARSPYKPEVITAEDGSKLLLNPNGDAAPTAGQSAPAQPTPDAVFDALIQQESGGRAGVMGQPTQYGRAVGMTQMLPATAQEMAGKLGLPWRPELLSADHA
jgi:soluble lytic murein transglycosylase-like protein